MKKLTLLAAMAVCGMGAANAQLVEPGIAETNGDIYDVLQLDQATIDGLTAAGKTVNLYTLDGVVRNLDVWAAGETLKANDPIGLGVDGQADGFISFEVVAPAEWSGGGMQLLEGGEMNTAHFSDATHFHMALKSSNPPAEMLITVLDDFADHGAKLSIGTVSVDGAPIVGEFDADGDWKAIDLSFADLKKLYPAFAYAYGNNQFKGYVYSFTSGKVPGKTFDIDAVYFYSPNNGAVESVKADNVDILVSSRTINATVAGFELYNIAGQLVKSTKSTVMGVEDLNAGLYVVKAGNTVKKVVIR